MEVKMSNKTAILLYGAVILCGIGLIWTGVRGNHYLGIVPVIIGGIGVFVESLSCMEKKK